MEESTNNTYFAFDLPKNQSSYIKVIGVGGGGTNAVNHMFRQGIKGVDFIVCNTDMKSLNASPVPNKIPLGELGLGAGNKPERARVAAENKTDEIREAISHNTQMLFITAGMGGGTGTGAAPVIAEIAKNIELDNSDTKKILVVAVVTKPFSFEGKRRIGQAIEGIDELRKHVDAILVINNDKLRTFNNYALSKAFGMANDVLLTAVKGIAEIITVDGYVNIDFQDVNTVMESSGTALMGTGLGTGENRAIDAIQQATTSVLLDDNDISGAKNVLLYFSFHPDHEITMDELGEITDYLGERTNNATDVIWGAGADESMGEELKVTLIATGFEKSENIAPKVLTLDQTSPTNPSEETPKLTSTPVDQAEPHIIQKPADTIHDTLTSEATTTPSAEVQTTQPVAEKPAQPVAQKPAQPIAEESIAPALEQPATPTWHTATQPKAEKRVFVLDPIPEEKPAASSVAAPASNPMQDIHVVTAQPAGGQAIPTPAIEQPMDKAVEAPKEVHVVQPTREPEPRPNFQPLGNSSLADRQVRDTAERIRRIQHMHELLRNDPNGAEKVENMTFEQISASTLFEGAHSSTNESSQLVIGSDGSMAKRPSFFDNAD